MKKRIGNDISFVWHIFRKSGETQTPESFTGKEVEVKLISPLQRPVTIEDVSIATGVVTFTFRGKHQVTLGNYVAVLLENRGEDGMVTLDVVNAVTLVPHSYMEEDGDEGDVIEASSVELESSISAGGGGGFVQQQADWAQTDTAAVDYIKNKPDLDLYCRKDVDNTHSDGVSDTFAKLVYDEHNPSVLMQADRLTVGGDSIKFYHSHRGEAIKELSLQLDDVEKLKDLPTGEELTEELADKQDTINDLAAIRSGAQAGSTAVQPADLTQIDNRLDDVEYCLGDYLKDTYVFNWENHTTTTTEPIYTTRELSTEYYGTTCDCKLSAGSATISALSLGVLDSSDRRMYFTQAGTVTMYLVLLANPSSFDRMIGIYDGSGNVLRYIYPGGIPYNSQHICTAITFEVEAGCYLQMVTTKPSLLSIIWLGQIDFEIAGITEVKQISKDVHANSAAIEAIEQKIPAQASSSNKLVDKNSLASVATSGSYNDLSDKPDLSAFITNSVDDLVNYYLKSETYTKTEVQQLIGAIQQFHYEVYPTLPQTGASNVLYLIGPTGTGTDKYEEYVYANNSWAKIGDTSIDLSGYVTTEALTTALADYVTSSALSVTLANYYNKTEVDGLLAGKENAMPIVQVASGTTAINAAVNTYYEVAGEVGVLAINLPTPTDLTKVSMVVIHLTAGTTPNVVIGSAETIDYSAAYDISASKEYEINCMYNGDKWIVADMEVA